MHKSNHRGHTFTSGYPHTQAMYSQAERSSRLHGGLAPRHLPSFIIHTAIYHTHAPAVHTNESLQPTNMDMGAAACVGVCI